LTSHGNEWFINLDLSNTSFPVEYKYGVYDVAQKRFIDFEAGGNRIFYGSAEAQKLTIVSDGVVVLSGDLYKVAV
jgi:4-alpha-glucanotransferase